MYRYYKLLLLIVTVFLYLPVVGFADIPEFFDQPDSGYTTNVVTDIITHDSAIWFATDEGLNFSYDGGQSWLLYDNSNGLVSSSISALFSLPSRFGQRIWAATNHQENIGGVITGISDGVSYSDDSGLTWTQVDFETAPNDIPYVWGGDRTIFDITGHYDPNNDSLDNWVFFTAFAGGFLASRDGGESWKRIFPTVADSIQFEVPNAQPSLRNRYFSCVADTSHGDTLIVWAGTAGGIFQYVFAEPKDKPFTKHVTDIEFCDSCGTGDSSFVYYGGLEGFTRGNKLTGLAVSKFISDGLLGSQITSMLDFGGKLFVGTAASADDYTSTGLAVSTDFGESFTATYNKPAFEGAGHRISDFAVMNDRIYMALEENGLYVSDDTGATWSYVIIDTLDTTPDNRRNVVNALEAVGDTLNIGTDSGLVRLYLSTSGTVDSSLQFVFPSNSTSSTKIIKVKTQPLSNGDVRLWTVNVPLDTVLNLATAITSYSLDGGQTFLPRFNVNGLNRNIGFIGDTAVIIGDYGTVYTDLGGVLPSESFPIYQKVPLSVDTLTNDTTFVVLDSLNADSLTSIKIKGDTVIVGGNKGYAVSLDRGSSFNITRVNTEFLAADFVLNYTSAIQGIDGDWVPALEVEYNDSFVFARVWASVRPTFGGVPGISVSWAAPVVDTLGDTLRYERLWGRVHDEFAWNFALASDTIFAATDNGLIYGITDSLLFGDITYDWTTVEMLDSTGASLLLEGTPVYAVEVDDNYIWAGTGDRTVRIDRSDLTLSKAFYVEDPTDEVYAFPIPFSHANSNRLDFHFIVKQQAAITIEIYDFAMHLVKRVVDNVTYDPGIYPTAGASRHVWDGLNGKGDEVAVGMYYFKIIYSTGEVHWGKIAVIP